MGLWEKGVHSDSGGAPTPRPAQYKSEVLTGTYKALLNLMDSLGHLSRLQASECCLIIVRALEPWNWLIPWPRTLLLVLFKSLFK